MDRSAEAAFAVRRKLLFIALGLLAASEILGLFGIGAGVHAEIPQYVRGSGYFLSACLLGGAIVFAASRPSRWSLMAVLVVGTALEIVHAALRFDAARSDLAARLTNVGAMYGVLALVVASVSVLRTRGEQRRAELLRLMETAIVPAYLLASRLPVELTVILHRTSLDARVLAVDQTLFGGQPAFAVGRLFAQMQTLRDIGTIVYIEIAVAVSIVYVLERRSGRRSDVQVAFLVSGIIGVTLYHLTPVAGPMHAFPSFPAAPPPVETALRLPHLAAPAFRNAIPSMHTTWALLVYWHARRLGRPARIAGAVCAVATIVSTLGLGEHYLTDVAISIPFAGAARAMLTKSVPLREPARWLPIGLGGFLFFLWVLVLRGPTSVFTNPYIVRTLAVVSTVIPFVLEARLERASALRRVAGATKHVEEACYPSMVN